MDSLDSEASAAHFRMLCCPCSMSRRRSSSRRASNAASKQQQAAISEDPELVFSRHRAAVIASHRFMTNHAGVWNLQNLAPPLPQLAPPPLPPRRLSSFFPPMPPMTPRRGSGESGGRAVSEGQSAQISGRKEQRIRTPAIVAPSPSIPPDSPPPPIVSAKQRPSTTSIACPYLSPVDVAATSWEWDFGNNETLNTGTEWMASPSDLESGATDRVNIWGDPPVVKKGLLMQQREKVWSRWKERYFILTRDYLHCFRRLRNVYRFHITLSSMGQFIYKLRLANVEEIRWESRRNTSRIALVITHESTILLRSSDSNTEALHHWYTLIQECVCMSKIRKSALRCFASSEENSSAHSRAAYLRAATATDSHSSYTIPTSATSGSSQTDILEIYRRVGSLQRQNASSAASKKSSAIGVHNNNQTRRSFYLNPPDRRPAVRPPTRLSRFLLPALDSESDEIDDNEIQGIMEGIPQRCTNPTREIEGSSSSSSHISEIKKNHLTIITNSTRSRSPPPPSEIMPRCESRVTLRDFVRTPWRSTSVLTQLPTPPPMESAASPTLLSTLREANLENGSRLSAFPVPSRRPPIPQRPMSSFSRPPPHVVGGRKVLPTPWMKNPTLQIGKGAAFSRSNVIMCPSKLSSDVTYLRRM